MNIIITYKYEHKNNNTNKTKSTTKSKNENVTSVRTKLVNFQIRYYLEMDSRRTVFCSNEKTTDICLQTKQNNIQITNDLNIFVLVRFCYQNGYLVPRFVTFSLTATRQKLPYAHGQNTPLLKAATGTKNWRRCLDICQFQPTCNTNRRKIRHSEHSKKM